MSPPAKNYGVWSANLGWFAGYNRNTQEVLWSSTTGMVIRFDLEVATEVASCKMLLGPCVVKYNPKGEQSTVAKVP